MRDLIVGTVATILFLASMLALVIMFMPEAP